MPRRAALALIAIAVGALSGPATASDHGPHPNPSLLPDDVVRIQLESLRDDEFGEGIVICFRFASPENRASTGPLERFARMIRRGPYALMLDYIDSTYGPMELRGDVARQRVTLASSTRVVTFVFVLSRQPGGACPGCWMTDAVLIEADARRVTMRASPHRRGGDETHDPTA